MAGRDWVKFYPADWLLGASILTAQERGVYITILMLIYDHGAPIPDETKTLAKQCALTPKIYADAMRSLVEHGKLTVEKGVIFSEKTMEILNDRLAASQRAGQSARQRWEKLQSNQQKDDAGAIQSQSNRNADAMPSQSDRNATKTKTQTKTTVSRVSTSLNNKILSPAQPTPEAGQGQAQGNEFSLEEKLRSAAGWKHPEPRLAQTGLIQALIDAGADLEIDVLPTVRALAAQPNSRTSWAYFVGPITDAHAARIKAAKGIGIPHAETVPASPSSGPTPPAKPARTTFRVYVDTPQWQAWATYGNRESPTRQWPTTEFRDVPGQFRNGWYFPSEWPPGSEPAATQEPAKSEEAA